MRKVLRSNDEVAHYWANQVQPEGRASSTFFRGDTIYSYGTHFPMATLYHPGGVAITTREYSVTTASHLSRVRRAVHHRKVVYVRFPNESALHQLNDTRREVDELLEKAKRARQNKPHLLSAAASKVEDFNTFAEWRGEPCRITTDLSALKEEIEAAETERIRREAEAAAKREADNAEGIAAWLAGIRSQCPRTAAPRLRIGKSRGTYATGGLLPDRGSEGVEVIETSWGAEIPVADAKRIWPLIQRQRGEDMAHDFGDRLPVGVYRLRQIRRDGSIVVGCHDIPYSELERIAVQLGLLEAVTA